MGGDITAMIWKDKQEMHVLTNMYELTVEGNFCDEHGKAQTAVTL